MTPGKSANVPTANLRAELMRPAAYAHAVEEVEFLQTHISWLFFAGERVYKVKKPVDLGFLDFTDLERRHHLCEEEVRLNRRLAPSVYLGVRPITRGADDHLSVDGSGEVVEWAVEMRRLPAHRMLSSLLDRGEIDNESINSAVTLLADFHARAPTGPGIDEHGSPAAIAANVEQNFEQLRDFVGPLATQDSCGAHVLSRTHWTFLRDRARAFLKNKRDLLERRVRQQRIREGHGDLHAENLCFAPDGVVAYDCIEFSSAFRCGDVASDLAFLTMDLDYRGYPGFSGYLTKRYVQVSGDQELPALENFYKGYRAVVRGKVAALTSADPKLDEARREREKLKAMRYLPLAASYELPPAMLLMCGLPASGKSWLAKHLARSLRASVLRSDVRRKLLSGMSPGTRVKEEYGEGLYSESMKEATYGSLLEDALEHLRSGHSVVVDATFARRQVRSTFVDAAVRLDLPYYFVHVTAEDEVIRERLERRKHDEREASDAGLEVYLHELQAFEEPTEVPAGHVLGCASGRGPVEAQSSQVIEGMIARADSESG